MPGAPAWSQSSVWFVDQLRLPIPPSHAHLHERTVWLSGIPPGVAASPTVVDVVCGLLEAAVGRVIAVTIRVEESAGGGGKVLIFASLEDPAKVEAAERAALTLTDGDGAAIKLTVRRCVCVRACVCVCACVRVCVCVYV